MSLHSLLSVSLATTPHQSPIRFSTTWGNCPEPGQPFNALTRWGVTVRLECEDETGTKFAGKDRDYTPADLIGWWLDPDAYRGLYDGPLTERQQAAEDHAEEENNQRRDDVADEYKRDSIHDLWADRDALASAGWVEEE